MTQTYRILVKGHLSETAGSVFGGASVSYLDGNTRLTCEIRDQSELQAVLIRVGDLGLTLLEVSATDQS
jgi:hypothetical protein